MHTKFIFFIPVTFLLLILHLNSTVNSGKYFFTNYDQVDHYSIKISNGRLDSLVNEDQRNELSQYLYGELPNSLDPKINRKLASTGFEHKKIPTEFFSELDSIFSTKTLNEEDIFNACTPVYRDFLVFRNKKSVVGIAQICFSCAHAIFFGSQSSTRYFGHHGEYKKLKNILKQVE